jgi:hypothetical protein
MARRSSILRGSRSGWTFADVLVAIFLVTLLAGVALPAAIGRQNEVANRVRCGSNMRQIGQAMLLYANENNGSFPRTVYDMKAGKVTSYTHVDAKNPFGKDGPDANDVTAPIFLLLRTQDLVPGVFVCPSSDAEALDPKTFAVQEHSNFPDSHRLSYSMQAPYPNADGVNNGFRWTNTLRAEVATAADMNPGSEELTKLTALSEKKELQKGNSRNHGGEGQTVLYGDGHCEFSHTPFCGTDQDNIYTYGPSGKTKGGDGISGQPVSANSDSILLPTANEGKPVKKEGAK